MRTLVQHLAINTLIVLAAIASVRAQGASEQPQNEIEVRGVYSIPSGDARFSLSGTSGTTIDFDRDFDFKNELGFGLRYTRRSKSDKHKFLVDYSETSWSRTTTLSRSFTFLGQTYVANLNTSSDLKLSYFRGMYAYRWGNEKFRIGPMVDMGVVSTDLKISGTTNSGARSGEASISTFAATIGYDIDYNPGSKVNIYHNLGAIAYSGERFLHAEGGIKYFPSRHFGLSGGYKFSRDKVTDGDDYITIRTHGPFFGGIVRF